MPKINKKKADKLLAKGDKLAEKGKFDKALKKYKKAHEYDPENKIIYDRLVKTHDEATEEWEAEDIVESVGWVMQKQELENPEIKMIHAQLTPEWKEIMEKIATLIQCDNEEAENKLIEEIRNFGSDAVYPLIHTILQIKRGASK